MVLPISHTLGILYQSCEPFPQLGLSKIPNNIGLNLGLRPPDFGMGGCGIFMKYYYIL